MRNHGVERDNTASEMQYLKLKTFTMGQSITTGNYCNFYSVMGIDTLFTLYDTNTLRPENSFSDTGTQIYYLCTK